MFTAKQLILPLMLLLGPLSTGATTASKPVAWSIEYPPSSRAEFPAAGLSRKSADPDQQQQGDRVANNQSSISLEEFSRSLARSLQPLAAPWPLDSGFILQAEPDLMSEFNNTANPIWSPSKLQQQLVQDYLLAAPQPKHARTIDQMMLSILNPPIKSFNSNLLQESAKKLQPISSSNKNTWIKPFTSKRRSYDPAVMINDAHIAKMVKFDDNLEQEFNHNKPAKDFLSRLPPLMYEAPAASNLAPIMDKENLFVDNLLAGSRYSGMVQQVPTYYQAAYYPATLATGHKYTLSSRKGLEKSIGFPILIGIGAALISFLILSNLFLSIPLLAMTLMQFFNGNNMIMPNNNPNPNNNNQNGNNGQTTTSGRKRRDVYLEQLIQKALDKKY